MVGDPCLAFWVPGHPKTKGSLTPKATRCHCCPACKGYVGRVYLADTASSSRWRSFVKYAAEQAMTPTLDAFPITGPVSVAISFTIKLRGEQVITDMVGDLDKLERNVLDALTDARVYGDDSQVVGLTSTKVAADELIGAYVRVWRWW